MLNYDGQKPDSFGFRKLQRIDYGIFTATTISKARLESKASYTGIKGDLFNLLYKLVLAEKRWYMLSYDHSDVYVLDEKCELSESAAHEIVKARLLGYQFAVKQDQ
ncbi:hypothetical protein [Thaumasiovibrio sp. DFM-14]|uniref:hypothetical protein n=1 Tax=Thaumasiovibrio sp. DFM-14 TaxID=3384792 RepID=UPI0039A02CA7